MLSRNFDIEGDVLGAIELCDTMLRQESGILEKLEELHQLGTLPIDEIGEVTALGTDLPTSHIETKERAKEAIEYHYGISNEFFSFWLDPSMTYTCAYFASHDEDLQTAQARKIDYVLPEITLARR